MSDGDALLSAILAQPDEDTPRLAYADWLDEQGGVSNAERAEFVRVQVGMALARSVDLEGREKYLLARHRDGWLAPLQADGGPLQGGATHGEFRRGFVEVVWMSAAWFAARAEVLFARAPVRELRVTRTTIEELAALVANPRFPRLRTLDLSDPRLGDSAARVLTQRPAVAALTGVRLRGCGLTDAGAIRLAGADFDWPLAELDVTHNAIGPAGLGALRDRFGAGAVRASG